MNYPEFDNVRLDYRAANEALQHGHYAKASRILRQALTESAETGEVNPMLLNSADMLAERYFVEGNYLNAASLYRTIIEARAKVLGIDHPDVKNARRKLAMAIWQTGGISPRLLEAQ